MMPPKMVPCGFVSRGSSVMRMAGSPYEFMTEEWRRPPRPVKRADLTGGRGEGGKRPCGRTSPRPARLPVSPSYNDGAGGNIQTLVVIAEPPVFGLLHPADARKSCQRRPTGVSFPESRIGETFGRTIRR